MRLVVDTNVLVAALLHPGRTPDRALSALLERGCVVLSDPRIEAEYRTVLARPKFAAIEPARRDHLIDRLLARAEAIVSAPLSVALIDDDDRMFVEVAVSGRADAVLTGNSRHFPRDLGFEVLAASELLARFNP